MELIVCYFVRFEMKTCGQRCDLLNVRTFYALQAATAKEVLASYAEQETGVHQLVVAVLFMPVRKY
jgi:hypothetical protein